jgi:hypothetical protein
MELTEPTVKYQDGLPLPVEDDAKYQKTAVVRMGLVKSADEAWQYFNQNFSHYGNPSCLCLVRGALAYSWPFLSRCAVAAWKGDGWALGSSTQTEGNGVEMGAVFKRVTSRTSHVKGQNGTRSVNRTNTAIYTCTAVNAPHSCSFEFTTSTGGSAAGHVDISLADQPTMFIHFAHQQSKSADGGFDLAITFTSTGETQPLICKILCLPCMLIGCIDMGRENRRFVEDNADKMKQKAQQVINGGPQAMGGAAPPVPVAVVEKSLGDKIKEISDLKEQGILSEEEFSAAKAKLIAGN